MNSAFRQFARQNWKLLGVFCAALIIAGWFAFKFVANFVFFNDPRNQDGDLKGWMNPHYITMMYDLPRPVVEDILSLPPRGDKRLRLGEIARERGLSMPEMTEIVRSGATLYREGQEK